MSRTLYTSNFLTRIRRNVHTPVITIMVEGGKFYSVYNGSIFIDTDFRSDVTTLSIFNHRRRRHHDHRCCRRRRQPV